MAGIRFPQALVAGRFLRRLNRFAALVGEGVALFPDAPTVRGRAHLEHLIAARGRGLRAAILFVIQRKDATAFAPNEEATGKATGKEVDTVVCRRIG